MLDVDNEKEDEAFLNNVITLTLLKNPPLELISNNGRPSVRSLSEDSGINKEPSLLLYVFLQNLNNLF